MDYTMNTENAFDSLVSRPGQNRDDICANATKRWMHCRDLMMQGLSIPQISRITKIKESTVRGYVRAILADAGVSSRLELLAREIERLRNRLRENEA